MVAPRSIRTGSACRRLAALALGFGALGSTACYHYSFEQTPAGAGGTSSASGASGASSSAAPRTVEYEVRAPTYLNGFVGTGEVDTTRFCERPVRTELRVTGTDVAISLATLLVYTPHTLYVTCPVDEPEARPEADRPSTRLHERSGRPADARAAR